MKKYEFSAQNQIEYPYIVARGVVSKLSEILQERCPNLPRIVLITDDTVAKFHSEQVTSSLRGATLDDIPLVIIPAGENSKKLAIAEQLIDSLLELQMDRRSLVVALGGGVVCDIVGFVSSIYMRGIEYLNIPTSLMAQVDASIGGKVAVNHEAGKNLIGNFWHPQAVVVDPNLLCSLPVKEIRNGLAEMVKIALIYSEDFFVAVENVSNCLADEIGRTDRHDTLIEQAIKAKLDLLISDPFEYSDLRRALNFGHTFAHPLEVSDGFQLRHGFAVSIGMCIATMIAVERGLLLPSLGDRIFGVLQAIGLPTCGPPLDPEVIWDNLKVIRRIRANQLHYVVPVELGRVDFIEDLTKDEFIKIYNGLRTEFVSTENETAQP